MNFVSGTHQGVWNICVFYWTFGIPFFYPHCTSSSRAILTVEPDLQLIKSKLNVGV